tara:strand:- start:870 stop:1010 length:141 start_codon:yes stop_codon:yes gene_type:complete
MLLLGLLSFFKLKLNSLLAAGGGEKRRKSYFRFDARAAFDVSMVTG